MHEKPTDNRYIFHYLKGSNTIIISRVPPTDADIVNAQIGILRTFRLVDMHYLGMDGRWQ